MLSRFGTWRSLAARSVRDAEVAGSNPAVPTSRKTGLNARSSCIPLPLREGGWGWGREAKQRRSGWGLCHFRSPCGTGPGGGGESALKPMNTGDYGPLCRCRKPGAGAPGLIVPADGCLHSPAAVPGGWMVPSHIHPTSRAGFPARPHRHRPAAGTGPIRPLQIRRKPEIAGTLPPPPAIRPGGVTAWSTIVATRSSRQ